MNTALAPVTSRRPARADASTARSEAAVSGRTIMTLSQALVLSTPVDSVSADARGASFTKRSIKGAAKVWGLKLAMSMIDVSTLEGMDSPGRVQSRCRKAIRPDPADPQVPACAAVCVYLTNVAQARRLVEGTTVKVASVATGFPAGQIPLEAKLFETRRAIADGAHEIDMVISRWALLSGDDAFVYDEIAAVKDACGDILLKVIVETGELGTYDLIRRASMIAMAAGADFIKTSTGKVPGRATLGNTQVMLEAIRDFRHQTGRVVGMKPAGNLNTGKLALAYLAQLYETLGPEWMTPALYRIGASSLMNDILLQLRKEKTGAYQSLDSFSLD
jgi:deoxyribose-phosphate aldolase